MSKKPINKPRDKISYRQRILNDLEQIDIILNDERYKSEWDNMFKTKDILEEKLKNHSNYQKNYQKQYRESSKCQKSI